jgi:release factor glutamine methyltransferase
MLMINTIEYYYLLSRKFIDKEYITDQAIRLLLAHVNNFQNTSELLLNLTKTMQNANQYQKYFNKLKQGIPLEYIINKTTFANNEFYIDNRVLIPRPETEEMFYTIKPIIENKFTKGIIVDVGTGSGCLAISIKNNFPHTKVIATDISRKAINVAKINSKRNNTEITFMRGNMLDPLIDKAIQVDMIITNPPYIVNPFTVDISVLNNEPHLALFTDNQLSHIKTLLKGVNKILKPNGCVWIEISPDQEQTIINRVQQESMMNISSHKDSNGKIRFISLFN